MPTYLVVLRKESLLFSKVFDKGQLNFISKLNIAFCNVQNFGTSYLAPS